AFTSRFPDKQIVELKIVLKDGIIISGRCDVTKGEPGNPHAPRDIERKFYQLATPIWGQQLTRDIHRACMQIESLADMRTFFPRLY
ncbi:MAG: hypothetical protein ABIF87_01665, partial [Pseudomonadota bacterium]